jgi:type I restriction enzyme, S subunit
VAIPFPPIEEQDAIVHEAEYILSIADENEKVIEQSLKRVDRLRQSILKRAFEGKLVPQDPNDEPASLLLDRIRAERTKPSAPRGRRRSINQVSLIQ